MSAVGAVWELLEAAADAADVEVEGFDWFELSRRIAYSSEILLDGSKPVSLGDQNQAQFFRGIEAGKDRAAELRELLALGEIEPIYKIARAANELNIALFPMAGHQVAGCTALIAGRPFAFISTRDQKEVLYTCARAIADALRLVGLDHGRDSALVYPPGLSERRRTGPSEHFADAFALEFLIPPRGLGIAAGKVRALLDVAADAIGDIELMYLSRIFGVSFAAMARRCERAKLLPQGGARALCEFIEQRFGDAEQRADHVGVPPRLSVVIPPVPELLRSAVNRAVANGTATLEQAAVELGVLPEALSTPVSCRKPTRSPQ